MFYFSNIQIYTVSKDQKDLCKQVLYETLFWRIIKQLINVNVMRSSCWLFNISQITFDWLSNSWFLQNSHWFKSFLHSDFARLFLFILVQRKTWGRPKRWWEIIHKNRAANSWDNRKMEARYSDTGVSEARMITVNRPIPLMGHTKAFDPVSCKTEP